MLTKPLPDTVKNTFESYSQDTQAELLRLRDLILKTADSIPGVGEIEEALKWGQPSFLTSKSKSGTTIRLDETKVGNGQYALYFHCQTKLVDRFRELYPDEFEYSGNRAILFAKDQPINIDALQHCVSMALTYHLDKK